MDSQDYIFKINDLSRSFNNHRVLNVPTLNIPRGKLVIIIGSSGCGKSTLLETLGLMVKPVLNPKQPNFESNANDISIVFTSSNDETIDYKDIWQNDDQGELLRKTYFSFLFQEANLLPNMNVEENILLSTIIQNGQINNIDWRDKYNKLLENVGLSKEIAKKNPINLSGGQKQRVAFARSAMRSFEVLFADEPTGNLDPVNARMVYDLMQQNIKDDSNKTAIIVTHNLKLGLEYADLVIPLEYDGKCGIVNEENIFYNNNEYWSNATKEYSNNDDAFEDIRAIIQPK